MTAIRRATWHRACAAVRRRDRGAVSAEFAIVLPAVMAMAVLLLAVTRAGMVAVDCQEAARTAARSIVVDGVQADLSGALAVAPGATVSLADQNGIVRISVRCPVLPGPLDVLPATVEGTAVAVRQ